MRLAITGALGHIGSALIRDPRLIETFDEIVIIDNLSTQRFPSLFALPSGTKYTFLQGDVTEHLTPELVSQSAAVIHLAASTDASASVLNPDDVFANNLRITEHAVDISHRTGTPLVFVSTTSVYTSPQEVVDENCTDLAPASPYAQCKLQEERQVLDRLGAGLSVVFRLGTIFGTSPGMRFHTAVNKFCWQAACGQPVEVWSTAMDQLRPYLAIDDAVDTLSRAVRKSIYPGQVVNAVTCDASVREVLQAIESYGTQVKFRIIDSPIMNKLSFRTSVNRAVGLGFGFSGDLPASVRETLQLLGNLAR